MIGMNTSIITLPSEALIKAGDGIFSLERGNAKDMSNLVSSEMIKVFTTIMVSLILG